VSISPRPFSEVELSSPSETLFQPALQTGRSFLSVLTRVHLGEEICGDWDCKTSMKQLFWEVVGYMVMDSVVMFVTVGAVHVFIKIT